MRWAGDQVDLDPAHGQGMRAWQCRGQRVLRIPPSRRGLTIVAGIDWVRRRRIPIAPTRRDWPRLLGELARQLNDGRVYDRDLPALARQLEPLLEAYRRRPYATGATLLR